ncbi:OmpA domain protein [Plesiocystis pacifica SIR-1]|uniref:OmpA domain protein n=2 Tax=Plesiocystis pacifica TaxID=191768 RepID=A6GA78_9BACT|nr:OmpA domain protein [Plesiocystis pacifica SIR-1]
MMARQARTLALVALSCALGFACTHASDTEPTQSLAEAPGSTALATSEQPTDAPVLAQASPEAAPPSDLDQDGIPDTLDQCPEDPEDVDGDADEDGCPDLLCRLDPCEIAIFEKVYFAYDESTIEPRSFPLLKDIAFVLGYSPQVTIQIAGHTDSKGRSEYNEGLSQRRVDSVREHLLSLGVNDQQLSSVGYGEMTPIDTNRTEAGRAHNRRVEFLRTDGGCGRP